MTYTTHYNLKKPELTDLVDVADLNFNSDTLDTAVYGKEDTTNKVTSIDDQSTDAQYPSAKCVYDLLSQTETKYTEIWDHDNVCKFTKTQLETMFSQKTPMCYQSHIVFLARSEEDGSKINVYYLTSISGAPKWNPIVYRISVDGSKNIVTDVPTRNFFSGNYNDLSNKPTIPTVPTNVSAFNNDAGYAQSSSLATVATSGSYNDLSNKLTAGTNITISANNEISATGGGSLPSGTNAGDILVWNGSVWVAQQPGRLPYGYTEIEYLESSGTQYIETDIILKGTTRIVIDFEFKDSFSQWGGIIGTWNENKQFVLTWNDSDGKVDARHGTSYTENLNFSRNKRYLLSFGETLIECSDLNWSYDRLSFEQSNTIGLFSYGHNNPKAERIWHFYHYESDVLLHEFVPCIRDSDSEPGMYDVVNGVFYTNDGTGDFIVPSES